jgi:hypothetical protein
LALSFPKREENTAFRSPMSYQEKERISEENARNRMEEKI